LKAKLLGENVQIEPMLSGGAHSLAASLDYAISKQPQWLLDMFGVSARGQSNAKRLFHVTNSHRKQSGPVAISLNSRVCPHDCVEVVLDGKCVVVDDLLRTVLDAVEASGTTIPSSHGKEPHEPCKNEGGFHLAA
jgi:hypothetical protein